MAAAVAVPFSAINDQLGGVLPPSALAQNSPRHGRSRGMSFKGKQGGRKYSLVEDRDVSIAKALMFVLKRTITQAEVDEEEDKTDNLVEDSEGWVNLSDLLKHPRISALEADLEDVQRIIANATKARFNLRQIPDADSKAAAQDAAAWQISRISASKRDSLPEPVPVPVGVPITAETEDLPEFIVYETSYQQYPLLVTLGSISHAPGGASYLSFTPIKASEDQTATPEQQAAEVSIWISLKAALESNPEIKWQRTESGAIITEDLVPKSLWKKAVARRPDIGLLLEDGEVRKEIPAGLRGKGSKGKAKNGNNVNQAALKREGSEDESASGNDE